MSSTGSSLLVVNSGSLSLWTKLNVCGSPKTKLNGKSSRAWKLILGGKNEGMINDEAKFQGRRAQGACLLTLAKPTAMHNGTLYRMFREATHIRWGWGVAQLAHANM